MRRETTLQCSGIRKTRRRRPVLCGADLEVAAGESVAIVGENGSGKSTLLHICAGVIRADAGVVQRPERTGLCPQQPGLIDLLTIDDHVRLTAAGTNDPRAATRRTRSLLDELGLDTGSRTTAAALSGGQRQKLNLALSLTNDPQLVLLDEPYQGFDHGSYLSLWNMLGRWTREGRSVVVITHLLAEHQRVDRVLTLKDGVLG